MGTTKQIIIISKCVKATKLGKGLVLHRFNFHGAYLGHYLKGLTLSFGQQLEKGEEYIMCINPVKVQDQILYGNILRHKKFSDLKYIF